MPIVEAYTEYLRRIRPILTEGINTWGATSFKDQAEAEAALAALTPKNPAMTAKLAAVAREVGLPTPRPSSIDLATWKGVRAANRSYHHAVRERWLFVILNKAKEVEKLPGKSTVPIETLFQSLDDYLWNPQRPGFPPPGWTKIDSLEDLDREAKSAARSGQKLIIYLWATWSSPSIALQEKILTDPDIAPKLQSYRRLVVDVSEGTDSDEAIAKRLGAKTSFFVGVWFDTGALAAYLGGSAPYPAPHFATETRIRAEDLAPHL